MLHSTQFPRPLKRALAAACLLGAALCQPAQAKEPLSIGSILSVTGPAAFLGEDMKAGMEMAIDDINAGGGINGQKVKWVFYDAESQTAKAINATRRLISQDKVDIIVGGGNMSGIALAMAPIVEKAGMPFISTEGSMQIVTPVDKRKYVFKSTVDDDQVIERVLDYFAKKGIKKVALLADSSGFGQSAVEQMKQIAPKRGVDVMYESFNPSDTDLTPQLTKIKGAGVQAIICWTVTPAGVVFIKQAKQLGLDKLTLVHSYGFVDQRYMKLAGDAVGNLLLVSVKFPVGSELPDTDNVKSRIVDLTKRFEAKYKRAPNQFAAQTYDAIMLARIALEKGGADKAKIRSALESIHGYKGVGGVFNFSPKSHSGLAKDDIVMLDYHDGAFHLADYK
ncbi:ABC transporter substrate-binding protein [Candidimonas nitroreducens]|uniref:ABC transporter substrate-binding protein n=1 Tax=Candidimonas nitroreducens TaxID=683354 RepID=A0A225M7P6_9BURK|nr:ABC transporter substrate-binding protein [Candidimonas nitroreducens]OWT56120.1 ABC transporter substrate-binding protein [Candidimonas nitroreducens]